MMALKQPAEVSSKGTHIRLGRQGTPVRSGGDLMSRSTLSLRPPEGLPPGLFVDHIALLEEGESMTPLVVVTLTAWIEGGIQLSEQSVFLDHMKRGSEIRRIVEFAYDGSQSGVQCDIRSEDSWLDAKILVGLPMGIEITIRAPPSGAHRSVLHLRLGEMVTDLPVTVYAD